MSRIIKKYPNRRLYDTKLSKYITLESVKKLVVENEKFIIDDELFKKNGFLKLSIGKKKHFKIIN